MPRPTTSNNAHPPINRIANSLGFLDIHIEHAEGVIQIDPNTAAKHAYYRSLPVAGCVAELRSDLTGEPAYRYVTMDVSLNLSLVELYRLIRHDLHPAEFFGLIQKYGVFHEIHDDFYDEETGLGLQPMEG
jgi:hypothetical protein